VKAFGRPTKATFGPGVPKNQNLARGYFTPEAKVGITVGGRSEEGHTQYD